MDAFEEVISEILWMEGHWTRTSFKVDLTQEDKAKIRRPTSPRWELDIVAYGGLHNIINVVECKSYIDSRGVSLAAFDGTNKKLANRFKLFNDDILRAVVFDRLRLQLAEKGLCPRRVEVRLCLACGRIASVKERESLKVFFESKNWKLWDETWIRERLSQMSEMGYENEVSAVVAKLLLRGR